MSKFAPNPVQTETRDYSGQRPGPINRSMETLFEGVGQAVQNFASMEDQLIKDDISLSAHDEVDSVAQGILNETGTADKQLPSEITRSAEGVDRLKSAYENGAFSEMYFTSQLMATSKRLKSRYPGYRDQIDGVIGSAAGSSMANQLRQEINRELKAQAQAEDEEAKFWRNWSKQEATGLVREFGTSDLNTIEQQYGISKQQAMDTVGKSAAYREDLAFQTGTLDKAKKEQWRQLASKNAIQFIDDEVKATVLSTGKPGSFQEIIADIMADGEVTSQEANFIETTVKPKLNEARIGLEQLMMSPVNEDGDSFASILGDEGTKQAKSAALAYIEGLERAIDDPKSGMMQFYARRLEFGTDRKVDEMLNGPSGEVLRGANALGKLGLTPEAMGAMGALDYNHNVSQAVMDSMRVKTFTGEKPGGETMRDMQRLEADAQAYNDMVDSWTRVLVSPDTNPKIVRDTVDSVYGEESHYMLRGFTPASRVAMYNKLTAQPVVDRILSMGKNSPEARKLRDWTQKQFALIARPYAKQVSQAEEGGRHTIEWDEARGQFNVSHTRAVKDELALFVGASDVRDVTTDAVHKINEYLVNFKYLADQSGANFNEVIKIMFNGLDVDSSEMWTQMVQGVSKPKEEDASEKP